MLPAVSLKQESSLIPNNENGKGVQSTVDNWNHGYSGVPLYIDGRHFSSAKMNVLS